MKGPTPVELPPTIISPNKTNIATIGMIHHIFICHRNHINSRAIASLSAVSLRNPMIYISIFLICVIGHCLSMILLPSMSESIPLLLKVFIASLGELTIGSPLTLKEVLRTIGVPVAL